MNIQVPCIWQMRGVIEIEVESPDASSLARAITQVIEQSPLPDGLYIDGSFEIDWEGISFENANVALPDLDQVRKLVEAL